MKQNYQMSDTADWKTRGRRFEADENAEWTELPNTCVELQHTLALQKTTTEKAGRGRIDILIKEDDGSYSIIEVKATDWDVMREHRVRPNILRHARQVMKYVNPYWENGLDVCPGVIYPRPPHSMDRKLQVEETLAEQSIQVVWFSERD
jgi:hypothetical protein